MIGEIAMVIGPIYKSGSFACRGGWAKAGGLLEGASLPLSITYSSPMHLKQKWRRRLIFGLLVALGALSWPLSGKALDPAPDWQLKDLQGNEVRLSDYRGKVIILDFWESLCAPCCWEIPSLVDLQRRNEARGLVVIGISYDRWSSLKGLPSFMQRMKINYPIVLGTSETKKRYGATEGYPTTFVIDRQGEIVTKHLGFTKGDVFEKEIEPLLRAN